MVKQRFKEGPLKNYVSVSFNIKFQSLLILTAKTNEKMQSKSIPVQGEKKFITTFLIWVEFCIFVFWSLLIPFFTFYSILICSYSAL